MEKLIKIKKLKKNMEKFFKMKKFWKKLIYIQIFEKNYGKKIN